MAKFLIEADFTSGESLKAVKKQGAVSREAAVKTAVESAGGKLECLYLALGDRDIVAIADLPDTASAVALAATVSASGYFKTRTTPLLTMAEADNAFAMKVDYKPPG
jgi:uncharacterized protein with GYD domain